LAALVASRIGICLVNILTSMSGRTLAFSTLQQLVKLGSNLLFFAAPLNTGLMPVPRLSIDVLFGITPPVVAIWVMYLLPVKRATHWLARSWFLLLAATPKSEPPRNTGAVWPALWLGMGNAPS